MIGGVYFGQYVDSDATFFLNWGFLTESNWGTSAEVNWPPTSEIQQDLFIVTTDWHLVSDDQEVGISGETHPSDAATVVEFIAALEPVGVIDLGDCKDHYGSNTEDEHANYITDVRDRMPWAAVSAESATHPILPGNHDELNDYNTLGSSTDFSPFNAAFWPAPYHWTVDWEFPKVRFIAIHSYIHHSQDGFAGFAHVDTTELAWLQGRIDDLDADWQAIVCSHFPAASTFGNYIHAVDSDFNSTAFSTLLAANASRITAYLNGHRHQNFLTATVSGITHISLPSMAYTFSNTLGGWVPITYDENARTLSFDYRLGPPSDHLRYGGFTPVQLSLPA